MRSTLTLLLYATVLLGVAACASGRSYEDQNSDLRRPPDQVPGSVYNFHPEDE